MDNPDINKQHIEIQNRIFEFRGIQVMLDRDLAELYNVKVKRLNEQVKRNIDRFPDSFRFQLNELEKTELVANCDRFQNIKHSSVNPYAFTEQGISMLSAILRSPTAIKVSIAIMNTFVEMRKFLVSHATVFQRLDNIELRQLEADNKFDKVFKALENKNTLPNQGIFFDGQIYDAYKFVTDIIKSANTSIQIIDNYIDDSIITLLSKKKRDVDCKIYTKSISNQLRLDINKFNQQYGNLVAILFNKSHDRFIIIDNKTIYLFGASLKDLGKKWFAFSIIKKESVNIINKINKLT